MTIGTRASWYLLGHAFWTEDFARRFFAILSKERTKAIKGRGNEAIGFHFRYNGQIFCYLYQLGEIIKCRLGHPY